MQLKFNDLLCFFSHFYSLIYYFAYASKNFFRLWYIWLLLYWCINSYICVLINFLVFSYLPWFVFFCPSLYLFDCFLLHLWGFLIFYLFVCFFAIRIFVCPFASLFDCCIVMYILRLFVSWFYYLFVCSFIICLFLQWLVYIYLFIVHLLIRFLFIKKILFVGFDWNNLVIFWNNFYLVFEILLGNFTSFPWKIMHKQNLCLGGNVLRTCIRVLFRQGDKLTINNSTYIVTQNLKSRMF